MNECEGEPARLRWTKAARAVVSEKEVPPGCHLSYQRSCGCHGPRCGGARTREDGGLQRGQMKLG